MSASPRRSASSSPAARRTGLWVLIATILGSSLAQIDGTTVNVALPVLQSDLHADVGAAQWVVESYLLFLSSLLLLGGGLGDRLGRRRIYTAGVTLFTFASVACGLAPSIGVLIAARAVQGVGAALLVPGSLALISATFPPAERGRAIGTWAGFAALTTGVGPVLGGWLIDNLSWRAIFYLNVPLAAAVLVIAFRSVPESWDEAAKGRIDWAGAALATLGLGGVVYGLIAASRSDPPFAIWGPALAGVALLVALLWTERRVSNPMMPLGVFSSSTFLGANLLTLLLYGALGGSLFFVPYDLLGVQGYSATGAGAALLPFVVLLFVLSRWSGGLLTRYGAKLPLVVGPLGAAVGFLLFARAADGGSYWTTFFPAVVCLALGMAIAIAPLTTAVMNAVPPEHAGVASGINNAASRVAGLLAIATLGIVMVQVFAHRFDDRLAGMPLSTGVAARLRAQTDRLVAIRLPPGVNPVARRAIRDAIDASLGSGFRVVMLLSALLAAGSAVVAALMIEGKVAMQTDPVECRGETAAG